MHRRATLQRRIPFSRAGLCVVLAAADIVATSRHNGVDTAGLTLGGTRYTKRATDRTSRVDLDG